MIRTKALTSRMTQLPAILIAFLLCGLTPGAFAGSLATVGLRGVTPRDVALSGNPAFDQVASGLANTPVGVKVYLQPTATTTTLLTYKWFIVSQPSGSVATLSGTTGTLVTLRPDKAGDYQIALVPQLASKDTTATMQTVHAGVFAGVGTINTHATPEPRAPQCGTGFCHGGGNADADLNVQPEWAQSAHAHKLENHMNGLKGSFYAVSCLPCHTLGYDTNTAAVNMGFDDIATSISYNLNLIPQLVTDSVNQALPKFPLLPAALQAKANVQCENCHGPGTSHPSQLSSTDHGIAGVNLGVSQCAQCHDSSSGNQQIVWQWSQMSHSATPTHTDSGCTKCHTGEGFVDQRVDALPAKTYTAPHSITCSTCHDPHFSENEHQLRLAGDYTFDSGQTYVNAGLGGLCMRCHNSRNTASTDAALIASSRGAHHGPQADVLDGINGYSFGQAFNANSAHTTSVPDTCVACHMAAPTQSGHGVITPPKVGGHTFSMRDGLGTTTTTDDVMNAVNACAGCHPGLTTFDRTARADYDGNGKIEGIQTEVRGLLAILKTKILLISGTSFSATSGEISVTTSGWNALTATKKGAIYNFNLVVRDASLGVHNTSYTIQLLQRTYTNLTGTPINVDFPAIVLRAPVSAKNDVNQWTVYN